METRLNFFKTNPSAMKTLGAAEERIAASGLDPILIELVRLRVSQVNGCAYCIDTHSKAARDVGESERRLATLPVWRDTPFFSDRERAALDWAEALTRVTDDHVPDAVWQTVQPHFSAEELVDLTLLVNTANTWNRFAIAFRKQPS